MWAVVFSLIFTGFIHASRAAEVCCPNIGCFTDDRPFAAQPLPWCIESINPTYTMYTRTGPVAGEVFTHNSALPPSFMPDKRTVFETHGWLGDDANDFLHVMKDEFLLKEDMNVVILGWEGGSQWLNYSQPAANTRSVGAYTALVMENLVVNGPSSDTLMWCVGHSLGSHVCGHTGMEMSNLSNPLTLGRATGLDPAGPLFEEVPDNTVGLNPTSAAFVDVIHTDYFYGTERDLGHIDFYPNGGDNQPSCTTASDVFSCSHFKSVEYFTLSISMDCFLSHLECANYSDLPGSCYECTCADGAAGCAIMGYGSDYGCQLTGMHYITVTDTSPYCTN